MDKGLATDYERPPHPLLRFSMFRNWISLAGIAIAAPGFFSFLLLFALDYFAKQESPCLGFSPKWEDEGNECVIRSRGIPNGPITIWEVSGFRREARKRQ